ncbi:mechanosensitive ion channel family protein [Psychromicrobium sp. YIM B11713]|uniref:mechanosensitive ion channel family protein n=1 Tax=Psychromicrobium sp. YIM B11713 TaxID=3145233 RepID=UPI00374FCF70
MTWTDDPALTSWISSAICIVIGLIFWLLGRFIIRRTVGRLIQGSSLFRRRGFRWAEPVLRPWDSERKVQRAKTIGSILTSLLGFVIVVIVAIYILLSFHVDVRPLLTSFGIVGVAVGFGCQQLIRDFLAGVFITIEDQYGIGDVIETSEVVGKVESVGLRITTVRGEDGAIWYLRNGEILRVGNRSQGEYQPPAEASDNAPQASSTGRPQTDSEEASKQHPGQRAGD